SALGASSCALAGSAVPSVPHRANPTRSTRIAECRRAVRERVSSFGAHASPSVRMDGFIECNMMWCDSFPQRNDGAGDDGVAPSTFGDRRVGRPYVWWLLSAAFMWRIESRSAFDVAPGPPATAPGGGCSEPRGPYHTSV